MTDIFFVQCIIKQLLDSVFVICRIIKASVGVISLSLRLQISAGQPSADSSSTETLHCLRRIENSIFSNAVRIKVFIPALFCGLLDFHSLSRRPYVFCFKKSDDTFNEYF